MVSFSRRPVGLWVVLLLGLFCIRTRAADTFRRGDANVDSGVDAADAMSILQSLFVTAASPDCLDALDANDDGAIDVSDSVYLLSFLFRGGRQPIWPFPDCGLDPTPDDLDCASYTECADCEALAAAAAAIGDGIPRVTCVPEDAGSFEFDTFLGALVVTVCPASESAPCGEGGEPGCAVEIRTVGVEIDLSPPRRIRFGVSGAAEDLPVTVASVIGGVPVLCRADLPFSVDVSMPLFVQGAGKGAIEIVGLGDPVFDRIDVDVSASGGLICGSIAGVKDLIIGELEAQAELITAAVLEQASASIVGRVLCAR